MALQRVSTAEELADTLQLEILDGVRAPGSRLPEVEVAERFEVSRNTLREALLVLMERGLVDRRPHRGATVARPDRARLEEAFRLRRVLEPAAVAHASPALGAGLTETAVALEAAAGARDWRRLADLDIAFHTGIIAAIGSPRLDAFFRSLLQTLRLAFMIVDIRPDASRPAHMAEHLHIAEAIAAGATSDAERLVIEHLETAERLLIAGLEPTGAEMREGG